MISTRFCVFVACITCIFSVQAFYIPNDDVLRFTVLGDWGGADKTPFTTPIEVAIAKAMGDAADLYKSQFTISVGDNFYEDGVKSVDDPRFQETFEKVFTAKSLQNPWHVIAGDHDYHGNVQAEIDYTNHSKRWEFPTFFYSMRYPIPACNSTVLFVMIDTIILCGTTHDDVTGAELPGPDDPVRAVDQWKWIEDTLKNSTDEYVIVVGHYPVWSIATHGPTPLLVSKLKPMLEKYRATAYFSGHDHNLQNFKEDNSSVEYFVIGSANAVDPSTAHASDVPPGSLKFHYADPSSLGGFAFMEVRASNATFTFIDAMSSKDMYERILYPRKK